MVSILWIRLLFALINSLYCCRWCFLCIAASESNWEYWLFNQPGVQKKFKALKVRGKKKKQIQIKNETCRNDWPVARTQIYTRQSMTLKQKQFQKTQSYWRIFCCVHVHRAIIERSKLQKDHEKISKFKIKQKNYTWEWFVHRSNVDSAPNTQYSLSLSISTSPYFSFSFFYFTLRMWIRFLNRFYLVADNATTQSIELP